MRSFFENLFVAWSAPEDADPGRREALVEALKSQLQRGFRWLHFSPELEPSFRSYLAASGRLSRIFLYSLLSVITLLLPSYNTYVLQEPAAVDAMVNPVIYGLTPFMLVAVWLIRRNPLSRLLDMYCLFTFALGIAVILYARAVSIAYGMQVPLEWVGLASTGLLVIVRIRFWYALPGVLAAMLATGLNEYWFVSTGSNGYRSVIALVLLTLVTTIGGYSLEHFIRRTWINSCLLDYVSRRDGLTGVFNRKALDEATVRLLAHARRARCAIAVAMLDVDDFKQYNDLYGHLAGDQVLRKLARILQAGVRRPLDFCGRYGGEEFVLAWVDLGYPEARQLAESVRARVEQAGWPHARSRAGDRVTVSVGLYWIDADAAVKLAEVMSSDSGQGVAPLLDAADKLLYRAKHEGRNRVVSDCD